jgi:hypothetical protein
MDFPTHPDADDEGQSHRHQNIAATGEYAIFFMGLLK